MNLQTSSPHLQTEVQELFDEIEKVLTHIDAQQQLSLDDIEYLRNIIFHIDGLLNSLEQRTEETHALILQEVTKNLREANQHLRKVLLREESTTFVHTPDKQKHHEKLFTGLIRRIQELK